MSPPASPLAAWMRGGAATTPNPPRVEHAPSGPSVHFTHAGLPCEARVLGRVREEGEEFFFVSVRVGGYLAPVAGLWKSTGLFDGLGRRAAAPGGLDERALHQAVGSALRRSRREWEPAALAVRRTESWPDRYGDFARALLAPAPPPEGGAARYVRDAGTRRIVAADASLPAVSAAGPRAWWLADAERALAFVRPHPARTDLPVWEVAVRVGGEWAVSLETEWRGDRLPARALVPSGARPRVEGWEPWVLVSPEENALGLTDAQAATVRALIAPRPSSRRVSEIRRGPGGVAWLPVNSGLSFAVRPDGEFDTMIGAPPPGTDLLWRVASGQILPPS